MNRNEIAEMFRQWIAEEKMYSAAMLSNKGFNPHEQARLCADGKLFRSRIGNILFSESEIRGKFEDLMFGKNKSVYSGADLESLKGLVKLHDRNKACANGHYLRFEDLGKSATLYIE